MTKRHDLHPEGDLEKRDTEPCFKYSNDHYSLAIQVDNVQTLRVVRNSHN